MTALLIAFLFVLLVPLLMATWRSSLLALALQGFLLGSIVLEGDATVSATTVIALVDLFVLRGLVAPLVLYVIMRHHRAPRRNNVLPANMLFWALAGGLVLLAFGFGGRLAPHDEPQALHLAVAGSGLLLGLVVLASQGTVFSQMIGLLRIENAIALFELSSEHHLPPLLQAGLSVVFLLTVVTLGVLLHRLGLTSEPEEGLAHRSTL